MQRIILDTNVLVSSLIQRNFPYLIINKLFIDDKIILCISDELISEYYEVLQREKFARYPDFIKAAEALLATVEAKALKFYPQTEVSLINDQADNRLLELAEESKANYLITGNSNDFTMEKYKETSIVTPKEYWEDYQPK
ncbi:putative toxin-antitoxin system toxin component, PIN family [Pontibacter sp. 172403-2]|uniref:putative toxin-antitoxin system toxin component, PIN family n=1 Tax=Pontibacter rufus TaxID=2791028 RepID=UPI0018AF80F5|nr:putative toxin-antitoxin system toxin component, PIN family [Pontibacter sp. 172403-2]MBF9253985.1 putative toxin-antitoxin system toxin component, PIN family [Pontibacter sp. 172403-2]